MPRRIVSLPRSSVETSRRTMKRGRTATPSSYAVLVAGTLLVVALDSGRVACCRGDYSHFGETSGKPSGWRREGGDYHRRRAYLGWQLPRPSMPGDLLLFNSCIHTQY